MPHKHLTRIIFSHIPKTAGTSVRTGLIEGLRSQRDPFIEYGIYRHADWMRPSSIPTFHFPENWSFIYGHFTARDIAANQHIRDASNETVFLSLVRDPFDRQISLYNFIAVTRRHPLHNDCITTDPFEFFAILSENFQNQLHKYLVCDQNLKWQFLIATNERVGEACSLAFEMVTKEWITPESFDRKENVTRSFIAKGKARKLTKSMFTQRQIDKFCDIHRLDMEIYEMVKSRGIMKTNPAWHLP